jgi:ribonucleotide reductase, class II
MFDTLDLKETVLPTATQQYIHQSKYSRWLEKEKRRETWYETCKRYMDFITEKSTELGSSLSYEEYRFLLESILHLKALPSMRAMMTAGIAAKASEIAIYNCSYLPINDIKSFSETLYLLACGTGVGFSVEKEYIEKLPTIPELTESDYLIVVEDSKIGWAESLRELLTHLYNGAIPRYSTHLVRPAGAKLKTHGGRASGPAPLEKLLNHVIDIFKSAQNRKLTSLEVHSIVCMIGDAIVSGGSRRSATISLSDLSDTSMQNAKSGEWWINNAHFSLANNSAVYTTKPDYETFSKEWQALKDSYSGERGIFNREAANISATKSGRRDGNYNWGTNPCLTAETLVLTNKGYIPIIELVDKDTIIWNGKQWSKVTPFSTGINPIVEVILSNGVILRCTKYHKFILSDNSRVEAINLSPGDRLDKFEFPVIEEGETYSVDAYSQGFYSGDGNKGYEFSYLYSPKYICKDRLIGLFSEDSTKDRLRWKHGPMLDKNFVPINGSKDYCLNWLAGLLDSDGCVVRNDNSTGLQICSINKDFLDRVRLMLTRLGADSKVVLATEGGYRDMPGGNYYCQPLYRLLINASQTSSLVSIGLSCSRLNINRINPNRDASRFVTVVEVIDKNEIEETYCFTDLLNNSGTFNGVVTANCGEIILRPYETCNLSEVIIRPEDDLDSLKAKIKAAVYFGVIQSTFTNFKYLREDWKKNAEEERLLGVSLTGIFDNLLMSGRLGKENLSKVLNILREYAIEVCKELAQRFGIKVSAAITCVKPAGTTSQLADTSPGIHPRWSKYQIRRYQENYESPVFSLLQKEGVPWEPLYTKPDTTCVFTFYKRSPNDAITRHEVNALEQLELWKIYKQDWCEHNPSITVYIRDDEWDEVKQWVWENFDSICGISFLPFDNGIYKHAPNEECTEEVYYEGIKSTPSIDWDQLKLYEQDDMTTGMQEYACVAGSCAI